MVTTFQEISDEYILNLKDSETCERDVLLIYVYQELSFLYMHFDAEAIHCFSLRMAQMTMKNGLCPISSLAFAFFGHPTSQQRACLSWIPCRHSFTEAGWQNQRSEMCIDSIWCCGAFCIMGSVSVRLYWLICTGHQCHAYVC